MNMALFILIAAEVPLVAVAPETRFATRPVQLQQCQKSQIAVGMRLILPCSYALSES